MALKLFAPPAYQDASPEVRDQVCNGCGTKAPLGWFVPDQIWFLDISEACMIHDWMYAAGRTIEDKDEADRTFLNNMVRIIDFYTSNPVLKALRYRRANAYYEAVHLFGGPAFWSGKNRNEFQYVLEVQNRW